jgi:hypothetical protein
MNVMQAHDQVRSRAPRGKWLRGCNSWVLLVLLGACKGPVLVLDPNGPDPWRARIASAYGIEVWPRIDTIQFTCQRYLPTPDGPRLLSERSWIHSPRDAWTWLILPGDLLAAPFPAWPLSRVPGEPVVDSGDPFSALREQFSADSEWLFLPYALAVDDTLSLRDQGLTRAPLGEEVARRIDVARALPEGSNGAPVSASGESQPAADELDAQSAELELFLSPANWILATRWGPGPERQVITWSEPWMAGGLGFSLQHVLPDGSWIEYTAIHVRLD